DTGWWVISREVQTHCTSLGVPDSGRAHCDCFQSCAGQCQVPWVVGIGRAWNTRACGDIDVSAVQVLDLVEWVIFKATWADDRTVHRVQVESTGIQQGQTHQGLCTRDRGGQVARVGQGLTELVAVLTSQGDGSGAAHGQTSDGVIGWRNTELTVQVALQFLGQEGFPLVVDWIVEVVLCWTVPVSVEGRRATNGHHQGDVVWLVQTRCVDVINPRIGVLGCTQTIQQVQASIAAALSWLDLDGNSAAHSVRPHVTALNPVCDGIPVTGTGSVWAQPVTVGSFCLGRTSNGDNSGHHDDRSQHCNGTAIKSHAGGSKELHVSPNKFWYNVQIAIFMYFTCIAQQPLSVNITKG